MLPQIRSMFQDVSIETLFFSFKFHCWNDIMNEKAGCYLDFCFSLELCEAFLNIDFVLQLVFTILRYLEKTWENTRCACLRPQWCCTCTWTHTPYRFACCVALQIASFPKLCEWRYQASRANYWLCKCLCHPESTTDWTCFWVPTSWMEQKIMACSKSTNFVYVAWRGENEEMNQLRGPLSCVSTMRPQAFFVATILSGSSNCQDKILSQEVTFITSWFGDLQRAMTIRRSEFVWFKSWRCTTFTFCSLAKVPMT